MGQVTLMLSSSITSVANVVGSPAHLPPLLPVYKHFGGKGFIFLVKFDISDLNLWVARSVDPCVDIVGEC